MTEAANPLAQWRETLAKLDLGKMMVWAVAFATVAGTLRVVVGAQFAGHQAPLNPAQVARNLEPIGKVTVTAPKPTPAPAPVTPAPAAEPAAPAPATAVSAPAEAAPVAAVSVPAVPAAPAAVAPTPAPAETAPPAPPAPRPQPAWLRHFQPMR